MPEIRCRRCGEPVPIGSERCSHCGAAAPEDVTSASAGPRTRFLEGDVLDGRYEIVEILPTGGMGELYKVRHVHLGDYRVVKLRKPMGKKDETGEKRFAREARLAASLKHSNLATLYDFSTLPDGSHYMVFEYVDGLTIAEHIQEGGRFETTQVLHVAEQTLSALSVLHNAGIIHRDIASDNLMLAVAPNGETIVKVIDLGIAKPLDGEGLTSTGFFVGKARYASPEQVNTGDPTPIDPRSDLYSLGIVLYEMVSGDVPFAASTPAASVIKRLTEDVTTVPPRDTAMFLEPDVEELILSLLRRDRDERIQSADAALAAVRKLLAKRPGSKDGSALARITRDRELHKLAASFDAEAALKKKGTLEMSIVDIQKAQLEDLREATEHGRAETPPPAPPPPAPSEGMKVEETEALPKLSKEARDRLMLGDQSDDPSTIPTDETPVLPGDMPEDDAAPTMPFSKYKQQGGTIAPEPSKKPSRDPITAPPPFMDVSLRDEDEIPTDEGKTPAPVEPKPEPPAAAPPKEESRKPAPPEPEPPVAEPPATVPVQAASPAPPAAEPDQPSRPAAYLDPVEKDRRTKTLLILALLFVFALLALGVAGFAAYKILQKISAASTPAPAAQVKVTDTDEPDTSEINELVPFGPPVPEGFVEPKAAEPEPPPTPKPAPPKPKPAPPPTPEPEPKIEPEVVETETEPPPPPPVVEGELVQPGPGVQDASIIAKGPLRLPVRARLRRARGTATIDILIGINGVPDEVRMVKRSGDTDIDEAALEAAKSSRFLPATKNGVRVRIWKRLEFGNQE